MPDAPPRPTLSPRQLDVVRLISRGMTNKEVAEALGISPRTAKAHADVLRAKLGVDRRRRIPEAYRQTFGENP